MLRSVLDYNFAICEARDFKMHAKELVVAEHDEVCHQARLQIHLNRCSIFSSGMTVGMALVDGNAFQKEKVSINFQSLDFPVVIKDGPDRPDWDKYPSASSIYHSYRPSCSGNSLGSSCRLEYILATEVFHGRMTQASHSPRTRISLKPLNRPNLD